MYKRKQPKSK